MMTTLIAMRITLTNKQRYQLCKYKVNNPWASKKTL
jgi:hypothetical protein